MNYAITELRNYGIRIYVGITAPHIRPRDPDETSLPVLSLA